MERLELILDDVSEAIIICDPWARILLFNPQARNLFVNTVALSPRHSLYGICHQAPFEDAFRFLQQNAAAGTRFTTRSNDTSFVCSTIRNPELLDCHMRMIGAESAHESVFVISFNHLDRQIDDETRKGSNLAGLIEKLRAPLANLHAASESLKSYPEMTPDERTAFENIISSESADLIRRYESVVRESRSLVYTRWPLSEVYSTDLLRCVINGLQPEDELNLTMTGVPLWLHADSYSLMIALQGLVGAVQKTCAVREIDLEVQPGEGKGYVDLVWKGEPLPQQLVESWLRTSLPEGAADMTVADVLERHNSDLWSQRHRRDGYALLRIPVPESDRHWENRPGTIPSRPEFYDPLPGEGRHDLGKMADCPLASLDYVVFDLETTGLKPAAGDDILAVAGVRIRNRRILSDDCFLSLVNPNRPIPQSAIAIHGITNEMVRGKPPIKVALPEFRAFVGDGVLVGHNPVFDMNFIGPAAARAEVGFPDTILDTLLLSAVASQDEPDHSLEAISLRLGVRATRRHTPLGDCFITAQIFLALLDLLATRGITTLGQAITASEKAAAARRQRSGL